MRTLVPLGRPDAFEVWKDKLTTMQAAGYSQGRMQRETGLAYNTVKTYLRRLQNDLLQVAEKDG
jgi:hypothetical protein